VAKPNLGTKQICPNCETRYFDLGQTPPTCPKCATVQDTTKTKAKTKVIVEPEPIEEKAAPAVEEDIDLEIEVEDDLESDDDDDDLIEDASDLGGDDDMAGVISQAEGGEET